MAQPWRGTVRFLRPERPGSGLFIKKGHEVPELSDKDWVTDLGFTVNITA